jgi:hypothetical protein
LGSTPATQLLVAYTTPAALRPEESIGDVAGGAAHGNGGQGDSLVPPHTRESVSLSLSLSQDVVARYTTSGWRVD